MKIVILGSTSTIARGLADAIEAEGTHQLIKLSRSAGNLDSFKDFSKFKFTDWYDWDLCINCIGKGTAKDRSSITAYDLEDYNRYDDVAIQGLYDRPDRKYVHLSSHIVERNMEEGDKDYGYWMVKRWMEFKHSLHHGKNIMDLRIPAVMSRYLRPDAGFFVTEAVEKALKGERADIWGSRFITYTTPYLIWRRINGVDDWKVEMRKWDVMDLIDTCVNGGHISLPSPIFIELYNYIRRRKNEETDTAAR